jgi:DNA modification methylase
MTALVVRGDARRLPLPDASVDLIVTSPPYWALRSYTDGGRHYDGQIGNEPTPAEYIAALVDCTREWTRVLRPAGSIFVNLGDKYSSPGGHTDHGASNRLEGRRHLRDQGRVHRSTATVGAPPKCLHLLPERYRIACADQLGLIVRQTLVWSKPNGMPESVTDRCRRSHEDWVHLVKQPRYYSAVDTLRQPHTRIWAGLNGGTKPAAARTDDHYNTALADGTAAPHPLGALPGSVWQVATEPLRVPAHLGVEHYAAFPTEWPRRLILGWSPPGICTACGEGRRPVGVSQFELQPDVSAARNVDHGKLDQWGSVPRGSTFRSVVGYACACTPYTDHPERRRPSVTPGRMMGRGHQGNDVRAAAAGSRHHGNDWPDREPTRDWHLDAWTPAPTVPAVVLDPFGGTGTTALVASALGRVGITIDRSGDYCRIARWRTTDPGQRAHAMRVPKPEVQPETQGEFDLFGGEAS